MQMRLVFCLCLITAWLGLSAVGAETRALWVDTWSPTLNNASNITRLVSDARAGRFNALFVEVRRRGDAFYSSNFEPKNPAVDAGFDPLADLLAKAHDTNAGPRLQIHAWIVTFPACETNNYPPVQTNHPLALHPEWLNQTYSGSLLSGNSYCFDPGHPGVQRHLFNVAMDLIARYDVDGLNWDYIRYPGATWGYNDVAVARFNSRAGRTGRPASSDPDWARFRREQVTALVRKVYLSALALKPQVVHSACTFTGSPVLTNDAGWTNSSAYRSVMQDWLAWMQEGILDLHTPMTYFAHAESAAAYTSWNHFIKNHRYQRHTLVGPSLSNNSLSNVVVQFRLTREPSPEGQSGQGVIGFSYAASNNEGKPFSELAKALTQPSSYDPLQPPVFAETDTPPTMPWKTAPTLGHLKGFLVDDQTNALDGATVQLAGPVSRTLASDATGFYGAVDLPPGNYTVTASFPGLAALTQPATISAGTVADASLTLAPNGLAITLQPFDRAALVDGNAQFDVVCTGVKPIRFQWLHNGVALAGATNSSLVLAPLQPSQDGLYHVTLSNSTGTLTSQSARLEVLFPIQTSVTGSGAINLSPHRTGYPAGTEVIVAAAPAPGFLFTNWSGALSGPANPARLVVSNALSLAAHFIPSPLDIVLDNTNATFSGTWTTSSATTTCYGDSYRYIATVAGNATASATYRPHIPISGNYDIFLWYPPGSNRATNAPWILTAGGITTTSVVNQTTGSGWIGLGSRLFTSGTNATIQLLNNTGAAGLFVMADAVRVVWSRVQPYAPLRLGRANPGVAAPFALTVSGNTSQVVALEVTTNFDRWLPLHNVWIRGPLNTWTDTAGASQGSRRFYRARPANTYWLTDFESATPGSRILFGVSGTTQAYVDSSQPRFTVVTNSFPAGNPSQRALLTSWSVPATNTTGAWLRLTTYEAPGLPNPIVGLDQTIGFALCASRPLFVVVGLRETSPDGPIGGNGGSDGNIEWVGGTSDNNATPSKGRWIPPNQWVWVEFCLPAEPVRSFTGNGALDSVTGKAVFEELALVPADGAGPYQVWLDDFQFISP